MNINFLLWLLKTYKRVNGDISIMEFYKQVNSLNAVEFKALQDVYSLCYDK